MPNNAKTNPTHHGNKNKLIINNTSKNTLFIFGYYSTVEFSSNTLSSSYFSIYKTDN